MESAAAGGGAEPGCDAPAPPPAGNAPVIQRALPDPWCPGCAHAHGLGWCGHAMRLTHQHLERRGIHFNWR